MCKINEKIVGVLQKKSESNDIFIWHYVDFYDEFTLEFETRQL